MHVPPLSPDEDTETRDGTCPCGTPGPSLPLQELVGDRSLLLRVGGIRQQTGDSPATSRDVNARIVTLQILEKATDQQK